MNSEIESTAIFEAISPAACPPMPSATRNSFASSETRNESSLCCRCRPTWVRPIALRFITRASALLEKGKPLSALLALPFSLPELGERGLYLDVVGIPLERLVQIALRLGAQAGAFADEARILQKNGVDRFALHGALDGLHRLARVRRNARRGQGEIVEPLGVGGVVLDRHVEILVGGAHVAVLVRLDALGHIGLGHLREVGGALVDAGGELGVVLLALGGIGQNVDRLGQELEAALGLGLVGAGIAVGVLLPSKA